MEADRFASPTSLTKDDADKSLEKEAYLQETQLFQLCEVSLPYAYCSYPMFTALTLFCYANLNFLITAQQLLGVIG
jgi:hypothetical protein